MSIEDVEDFCKVCGKLARTERKCYAHEDAICACEVVKVIKDWQGRDVIARETPETEIKWWVVDCLVGNEHDEIWIRGWQDMLAYVSDNLECHLESFDEDELTDGAKIKIRLQTGTKAHYDEIVSES